MEYTKAGAQKFSEKRERGQLGRDYAVPRKMKTKTKVDGTGEPERRAGEKRHLERAARAELESSEEPDQDRAEVSSPEELSEAMRKTMPREECKARTELEVETGMAAQFAEWPSEPTGGPDCGSACCG